MKIGIYSPYLDTAGGGERYMLTIAEVLSGSYEVDVFLDAHLKELDLEKIIDKNSKLLDLDLAKANFIPAPFGKGSSFPQRLSFLKKYDILFYLTDGSVFYSTAKKSILHIQSPIKVSNASIWEKIKKSSWDLIIYNSNFTKNYSEKYWDLKGKVIYPPVDIYSVKPGKKKKQIITVGRFFGYTKSKKHELMIDTFKKIVDSKKAVGWTFQLAGGAEDGDEYYIKKLEKAAEGYPIYIHKNLPFEKLKELYSESSIYWHAAGFGETDPAKMEHFGITTVEAMAAGCVPVVINLGGQKEIVEGGVNGFLWDSPEGLEQTTNKLISDGDLVKRISAKALASVKKFSKEEFAKRINEIV